MVEQRNGLLTDLADLPPVGTPERREWDRTIEEAYELYPDWAWITLGKARLRRETYEEHYRDYFEVDDSPLGCAAGTRSSGQEGSWPDDR
jgi:hypothetical protein